MGPTARFGAFAFIHRFGSTRNPHIASPCVVIDGVFEPAPAAGVDFHSATGVDAAAIAWVQAQVRRRLLRIFMRRVLLPGDAAPVMGQWEHGFSLDASVRIEAADRAGRERLLRYYTRPQLALERLCVLDPEPLIYDHPKRGSGGSGARRLTPFELLDRLDALLLPRLHHHRYFGATARTTAYWEFPRRPRPSGRGRYEKLSITANSCRSRPPRNLPLSGH